MKYALFSLLTLTFSSLCLSADQTPAEGNKTMGSGDKIETSPLGNPVLVKNVERRAPFLGVPIPWKLSDGDVISLRRIRVESRILSSAAETNVVLSMRNTGDKECKVMMAIPVMMDNSTIAEGLTAEWGISALQVLVDGKEVKSLDYKEDDFHPQKDAPSLSLLQAVNRWIVFPVEFKAHQELLVEMKTILPYGRKITEENGNEIVDAPLYKFYLNSGRIWKDELHWGILCLDSQEISPSRLSILEPQGVKWGKKNGEWYEWPLTSDDLARVNPLCIKIGAAVQFMKGGRVVIQGMGEGQLSRDYTVKTSSSLSETSPDLLKTSEGAWADGVSGDGKGEWLELSLNQSAPILGIALVNGRNPMFLGEEERKHPDLSHSFYGSVKKALVTLNNEYTFPVTLFDDWCPQVIIPPNYGKPVKNIKVQLEDVRGGKASADTYISELLPILKK